MGVLLSNKICSQIGPFTVTPNIYVLNLGKSGSGKDAGQKINSRLLSGSNLMGSGAYKSGVAWVSDFPRQQEILYML
jgi:hypothetical protein